MEKQNSQKNRRPLNYQVIQLAKEKQLHAKEASIRKAIAASHEKIAEFENQIVGHTNAIERHVVTIAAYENACGTELKDAKTKIATLEKELEAARLSLSEHEGELNKILEEKQKESQDSPRALEVKGRLAYLNTEINENSFKIEEYKKEAKREQLLATQIEKLKKEEETLNTLIASGETSPKRNYVEELDIAVKERHGFEKQLEDFRREEEIEIKRLSDINAEMGLEVAELNKELSEIRATQDDATAAMQRIESQPEIIKLRKDIENDNAAIAAADAAIAQENAKIADSQAKALEKARQEGKEQEHLAEVKQYESAKKDILETKEMIASTEKQIGNVRLLIAKNEDKLREVEASILECNNYNTWVANNKRFSEEMYPRALEKAARDIKKDRKRATADLRPELAKEAETVLKAEIEACRKRAQETVDARRIKPKGAVRDTAIDRLADNLIKRRVDKYIEEIVRDGRSELWNKQFRKIRDARLAQIEQELSAAKKALDKDAESEEAKEEFAAATKAKEMFERVESDNTLLVIRNVRKYFPVEKSFFGRPTRYLKAVDDVSLRVQRGKTLGIVGESGCGKTTMGRTILRLHEITDGEIIFDGHHLESLSNKEMRSLRTDLQIIFQDPYSSLSPRLPIGEIIGEAVRAHNLVPKSEYKDYILGVMKSCGLQPHHFSRFPHEFSGGQRQRICIARALAVNPKVVICDEPVSALDVSIQAQIINLLKDLQQTRNLTYIFISHDLSVVEHISDDVGVMYLGSMVESGPKEKIFENPMHPYTEALLSAVPIPDPNVKMNRIFLKGDIPSPSRPPRGCKFHTRCQKCMDICKIMPPVYREYEKDHFVACHLYPQD